MLPRVEVLPGGRAALDSGLDAMLRSHETAVAIAVRRGSADPAAPQPTRGSAGLARRLGLDVAAVAARERAGTAAGDLTRVPAGQPGAPAQVYLIGVGAGTPAELRTAAATLVRSIRGATVLVSSLAAGAGAEGARAVAEGTLLGAYRVARTGKKASEAKPGSTGPATVQLSGVAAGSLAAVRAGLIAASATNQARDLANTRSSTKGPAWLATRAREVARAGGLTAKVWSEADLRREGFAALVAVGAAADRGPRLVQLDYSPGTSDSRGASDRETHPHVVLAGKGITFDTGGISLKPREAMLGMTTDMTGAAVVLAVLGACREFGVQARVTGLMPLAENAFGADSYRPADVVRTYDGTTVEVRNTDAEGRMVLADALGYARTQLRPDVIVDIATLTGAATMGLGRGHGAMYATDDRLGAALLQAGEASGERLWRMPLVADYRQYIDSDVADLCQISTDRAAGAGSIMAALFLREFVGDVPWAHLDIAGPGRSDRDRGEINRGGTGFGARLLLRWLQTL